MGVQPHLLFSLGGQSHGMRNEVYIENEMPRDRPSCIRVFCDEVEFPPNR
jgi:hypothetical protein